MMESFRRIRSMGRGVILGRMGRDILGGGSGGSSMGKEFTLVEKNRDMGCGRREIACVG